MHILNNISRRAIVGLWLFVSLAPFCWILFVVENRWQWFRITPILPGMVVTVLSRSVSHASDSISLLLSGIISLVMAVGSLFLMFRFPRWRLFVTALVLLSYCFFSWFAYKLYQL